MGNDLSDVVSLTALEFDRHYASVVRDPSMALDGAAEAKQAEWKQVSDLLDAELGKRWKKSRFGGNDLDYAMSLERPSIRQVSIGIYSERIFCHEFIRIVRQVLGRTEKAYVVHVACELEAKAAPPWGEMFVTKDKAYVKDDSAGLVELFQR